MRTNMLVSSFSVKLHDAIDHWQRRIRYQLTNDDVWDECGNIRSESWLEYELNGFYQTMMSFLTRDEWDDLKEHFDLYARSLRDAHLEKSELPQSLKMEYQEDFDMT
jgi:hypothetical protein